MNHRSRSTSGDRGSAMIIVLAMLIIVSSIVISNGLVLHHLRAEMRLIERHQQERLTELKR